MVADTNRQSNMHMVAYGIIYHQSWRMGPSLEADRELRLWFNKLNEVLLFNETILVNIVVFIHS